ncbi:MULTISPECIES: endo alpha-1,4 polygalactosaminidase [unclassified Geodermatophilus]
MGRLPSVPNRHRPPGGDRLLTFPRRTCVLVLVAMVVSGCAGGSSRDDDPAGTAAPASSTSSASPGPSNGAGTSEPSAAPSSSGVPSGADDTAGSGPRDPGGGTSTAAPSGAGDAPGTSTPWRPAPGTTWQYQLSGALDLSVDADVYDVDWQETTAEQVRQLHDAGRRVICYVNAGAYEEWRPDAGAYPEEVLGRPLDDWPGERWLDIRRTDVLLPILAARFDACRAKGFDAVEADNVDGYTNDTGFPLTAQDQLAFNTAVAGLAHDRGMSVALKNDVEQVTDLAPVFDFAVNEECLVYDECEAYRPFLALGKAVLHVEYTAPPREQCVLASSLGMSTILKDVDLGPGLRHC